MIEEDTNFFETAIYLASATFNGDKLINFYASKTEDYLWLS